MNSTLSKVITFAAGATIGSAVTFFVVKRKYEQLANEEINAIRDYYSSREADKIVEEGEDEEYEPDPADLKAAADIIKSSNYSDSSDQNGEEEDDMDDIYVIPPDEYDENGYETETLFYFVDGVVTDTNNEVIENYEELIGDDALNHFGEYEEDSVFVRNDYLKTDFEILKDERRFSEVK